MDLKKAIKSRKSVKKFNSKKPDWRDIIEAIDTARYAPMAGGSYTVKFILVDDKEKIQKLADASQQPFICKAHYVVAVCSNGKRTVNAYGSRGELYVRQQAGAVIENFLLAIQEKGLGTCWIGHFTDSEVQRILEIPEGINVEALFPIGYPAEKTRTKEAPIDLDRILYFNKYNEKKMKKPNHTDA